jgi:hypothetical protein
MSLRVVSGSVEQSRHDGSKFAGTVETVLERKKSERKLDSLVLKVTMMCSRRM